LVNKGLEREGRKFFPFARSPDILAEIVGKGQQILPISYPNPLPDSASAFPYCSSLTRLGTITISSIRLRASRSGLSSPQHKTGAPLNSNRVMGHTRSLPWYRVEPPDILAPRSPAAAAFPGRLPARRAGSVLLPRIRLLNSRRAPPIPEWCPVGQGCRADPRTAHPGAILALRSSTTKAARRPPRCAHGIADALPDSITIVVIRPPSDGHDGGMERNLPGASGVLHHQPRLTGLPQPRGDGGAEQRGFQVASLSMRVRVRVSLFRRHLRTAGCTGRLKSCHPAQVSPAPPARR